MTTLTYSGSCHCGAVRFCFDSEQIVRALRCDCSICIRKGAPMLADPLAPGALKVEAAPDSLGSYSFGSGIARHYFCRHCGIYTHHETRRMPGHLRVNLGCVEGLDSLALPVTVFNGQAL